MVKWCYLSVSELFERWTFYFNATVLNAGLMFSRETLQPVNFTCLSMRSLR